MKKFLSTLIILTVLFSAVLLLPNIEHTKFAIAEGNYEPLNIISYGDSIPSGYLLSGFDDYATGKTQITMGSYPQIFSEPYIEAFGGQIKSFAIPGDESWQLLNILQSHSDVADENYGDFSTTDIFTLCIGANNVLSVATQYLTPLLIGNMTNEEYRPLLQEGVDQFNEDYAHILKIFN